MRERPTLVAGARRESRLSCGQYTVNDLPTFECSAFCAPPKIQYSPVFNATRKFNSRRLHHLDYFVSIAFMKVAASSPLISIPEDQLIPLAVPEESDRLRVSADAPRRRQRRRSYTRLKIERAAS